MKKEIFELAFLFLFIFAVITTPFVVICGWFDIWSTDAKIIFTFLNVCISGILSLILGSYNKYLRY